jgi:hypothetical protein
MYRKILTAIFSALRGPKGMTPGGVSPGKGWLPDRSQEPPIDFENRFPLFSMENMSISPFLGANPRSAKRDRVFSSHHF